MKAFTYFRSSSQPVLFVLCWKARMFLCYVVKLELQSIGTSLELHGQLIHPQKMDTHRYLTKTFAKSRAKKSTWTRLGNWLGLYTQACQLRETTENLNRLKLLAFNLHGARLEGVRAKPAFPYNAITTMTLWVSVVHTIKISEFAPKNE